MPRPSTTGSAVAAGGSEKPAAAGGTEIQDLPLVVELPAGAVPNDGGSGFHSADESIYIMVKKVGEAEAKTMEAAKKASEEFLKALDHWKDDATLRNLGDNHAQRTATVLVK